MLLRVYMYRLFAALDNEGSFFKPLDVASRVIFPDSSVDDTMAVIMPENTFMWGAWNDSNDVGSPVGSAGSILFLLP